MLSNNIRSDEYPHLLNIHIPFGKISSRLSRRLLKDTYEYATVYNSDGTIGHRHSMLYSNDINKWFLPNDNLIDIVNTPLDQIDLVVSVLNIRDSCEKYDKIIFEIFYKESSTNVKRKRIHKYYDVMHRVNRLIEYMYNDKRLITYNDSKIGERWCVQSIKSKKLDLQCLVCMS